jgi:histidyl-tRNA synthetase
MTKMKVQSAKGVRDIPPEEKILKDQIIIKLKQVFEIYGFVPLESAIVQRYDTLASKFAAGETSDALKETFKLTDQGKRELGLRFDLTVPLAAFVAQNPTMKMPFKRYEVGTVFRDGPIKLGRYRSFTQMDVDIIGTRSMLADAEIVAILETGFENIGLDVTIKINNRKLLNGILEQAGIENKEEAIISIDKLDKIGKSGVSEELIGKKFNQKQIDEMFSLISENITLEKLKNKITSEEGKEGLLELEELFAFLKSMNITKAKFDVSLARGLAYYTGTAFEVFLNDESFKSSLAGGGRYDKMVGQYLGGGRDIPAVGVAFGIAPIMDVLKMKEMKVNKTTAKVLVIPIKTIEESLKIVQKLRNAKVPSDFAIAKKGVSKNLEYANTLGIPYVVIVGQRELEEKKVVLRDMESGEETKVAIDKIVSKIQEELEP